MREVFRPYFPAFEEFAAVSFSKFWFLGNFFSRQIGEKKLGGNFWKFVALPTPESLAAIGKNESDLNVKQSFQMPGKEMESEKVKLFFQYVGSEICDFHQRP